MSDIIIGGKWINKDDETTIAVDSVWKHKIKTDCYVKVGMVSNGEVFHVNENGGKKEVEDIYDFLDFYSLHKSADQVIAVDSVWRHKEDGELVYIESDDGTSCWNLNFSPLGEADMYADDTKGFLSQYEFVCDSKYDSSLAFNAPSVAPDMSVAIGDVWQARCEGFKCKVVDIKVNDGVTWVTTQSVDDEDAVESDKLRDFFEGYRFIGKGGVNQDLTSEKGTSLLGDAINPSHYQSDPSGVQCIEISENWSFCLGNALKYMWRSGKKDSSKNIEDLQKAVWYIEREISRLDKGGV